jgi:hypothetical protein
VKPVWLNGTFPLLSIPKLTTFGRPTTEDSFSDPKLTTLGFTVDNSFRESNGYFSGINCCLVIDFFFI